MVRGIAVSENGPKGIRPSGNVQAWDALQFEWASRAFIRAYTSTEPTTAPPATSRNDTCQTGPKPTHGAAARSRNRTDRSVRSAQPSGASGRGYLILPGIEADVGNGVAERERRRKPKPRDLAACASQRRISGSLRARDGLGSAKRSRPHRMLLSHTAQRLPEVLLFCLLTQSVRPKLASPALGSSAHPHRCWLARARACELACERACVQHQRLDLRP